MEEAPHDTLIVILEGLLLETADAEHLAEERDFLPGSQLCIDRILGIIGMRG